MRRCSTCFHYVVGHPPYCPYCGRTYNVRICNRGHVNARGVQFCTTCGATELSTPAAREDFLAKLSRWALLWFIGLFFCIVGLALLAGAVASIDWHKVMPALLRLAFVIWLMYWASTKLPGPVKKVGKVAGRGVVKLVRSRRSKGASRR